MKARLYSRQDRNIQYAIVMKLPEINRLWNTYYGKPLPGMEDTTPERIAALVAKGDMITLANAYGTDEFLLVVPLEGSDAICVIDEYCPNPECPCQTAALHFYSAEPSQNSESLFEVMVNLKTRSYNIEFSSCDKDFIGKTMNILLAGTHSFIPLLTGRRKELRQFMAAHMPVVVSEAGKRIPAIRQIVTGRNDTCPCGSGKKYKKCCGIN